MGPQKKTKKKEAILSKNNDFEWLANIIGFFGGVISGNIKPLGGLPGTNPGFLETHISAKSQGLKTSGSVVLRFLKFVVNSSNVVALTFRCGSR